MAKKITDFSELPQWFRDSDYLQAQRFSDIDWFFHLEARFQIMEWGQEIEDSAQAVENEQNLDRREVYEDDLANYRNLRTEQLEIIRQNPASPLAPDAALTELGPVGTQDHGQMCVVRWFYFKRFQHVHLSRRIVQMIIASYDMSYTHVRVVHDN